jgi:endonuclease/exonuclease/phosphatase family metal-dependent hydrolase
MIGRCRFLIGLSMAIAAASAGAQQPVPFAGDRIVKVMTQNVYNGVDDLLAQLPAATGFVDLATRVAAVYGGYFERNFPERAAALAAEIDAKRPDFLALQEAILVRTQAPADGPVTPATAVALDYVGILLDALAARGLHYEVVAQSPNFDAELPSALGFDVRHTDREVILARADLRAADLRISNVQGGNFAATCTVPTPLIGPIAFRRGWVSVDAKVRGRSFRLISTHFDVACLPFTTAIQRAQAAELLAGPAATELPVVIVGDFNSPGDGTGVTYNDVTAAGFADAALQAGAGDPTCCQAPDVRNAVSLLGTRIDVVLFRGRFGVLAADVVGDRLADRTPSGRWPSDHAGVTATLRLPQP